MQLLSTNRDSQDAAQAIFSIFHTGTNPTVPLKNRLHWFDVEPSSRFLRSFDSFIGMELSIVPEVESVFVKSDNENGKGYTVLTVIDERDPTIRAKIYAREEAIMDAALGIDFSFRVVSRMGRDLRDVIDDAGKLAYQR
jgi:hypothetical protein